MTAGFWHLPRVMVATEPVTDPSPAQRTEPPARSVLAPPGGSSGGVASKKMRSGGGVCVRCSNKLAAKIQRTDLVAFLWLLAGIIFAVCAVVGPGQGDIIGPDGLFMCSLHSALRWACCTHS